MISARALLTFLLLATFPLSAQAQSATDSAVGTLVYFEGSVDIKAPNGSWSGAEIEQSLQPKHQIRTGPAATAEIEWKNGTKSTLGPKSTQPIGPLFESASSSKTGSAASVTDRLMELFEGESSENDDVGGIRRAAVKTDQHSGPGELHWKTFEAVSFSDAQTAFRDEKYSAAIRKFHLFLQQHPDHAMAPKAQLGLGISYLKLNNPDQARSTLDSLVSTHPDTPIADQARSLLDRL